MLVAPEHALLGSSRHFHPQLAMPPAARLARLAAHTVPSAAVVDEALFAAPKDAPMEGPLRLLDDSAMAAFVADGYVTLPVSEFGAAFHSNIHERATELFTTQLNYGNTRNIYPVIPELEQVRCVPAASCHLSVHARCHAYHRPRDLSR